MSTNLLKEASYEAFRRRNLCESKGDFYKKLLTILGFPPNDNEQAFRMSKDMTAEDLIEAVIKYNEFKSILIIMDNIDELTDITIKESVIFSIKIAKHARKFPNMPFTVLIPVRDYTAKRFLDQDHFSFIRLPPISASKVVGIKLEHARNEIQNITNKYSQEINFEKKGHGVQSITASTITITPISACDFLINLAKYITSDKEQELRELLFGVSSGNLKYLVENVYNFIHSCKLPIVPLFKAVFAPKDGSIKDDGVFQTISFNQAIECLMCVHYPFYDVRDSNILNIFKVDSSSCVNNYRNTLTIPRILGFMHNGEHVTYLATVNTFRLYGYDKDIIDLGINRCLEYGIIKAENGRHVGHLSDDNLLSLSASGTMYLKRILPTRYLRFVSEDTPMAEEYIIPLNKKYLEINSSLKPIDAHASCVMSENSFIDFLQNEEAEEQKYIEDKLGLSWKDYIHKVGMPGREGAITLIDYLQRHRATENS